MSDREKAINALGSLDAATALMEVLPYSTIPGWLDVADVAAWFREAGWAPRPVPSGDRASLSGRLRNAANYQYVPPAPALLIEAAEALEAEANRGQQPIHKQSEEES